MTNKEAKRILQFCIPMKTDKQREAINLAIKALEEKQQGEWIDRMADKGYVECPFCHKQITGGDLNFCVKCGANMRGSQE